MIEISISQALKQLYSKIVLGCLEAKVEVSSSGKELCEQIDNTSIKIAKEVSIKTINQLPNLKESREAYKLFGKDPSRYRLSSESLIRRIVQGKEIYKTNNIVDINNLISITSLYSVGSYDLDKLESPVVFTLGKTGDFYKGIGKGVINVENLPVFSDRTGNFGSPTSDSERAMITVETNRILMSIFSFSGKNDLDKYLNYARELLEKYAKGKDFKVKIVE